MTIRPQIPRVSGIDQKVAAILAPMRQIVQELQVNAVRTSAFRSGSGFRYENGVVELVEENPLFENPVANLRETIERRIADLEVATGDVLNVADKLFSDKDFGLLIGDLAAQSKTLKVNINGHIAGYGVAAYAGAEGQVTSDFVIQADRFSVVFPNPPWTANQAYTLGQYVSATDSLGTSVIFQCTTAGTSGSTEPSWNTSISATTNDGTVVWTTRSISERVPFIVGNIGGVSGVGINGDLIVDGTIVANALDVNTLSAITANVGTLVVAAAGYIRSGQTAYNTGTGWFLGNNSGTPVLSIGTPGGNRLTWDGSLFTVQGQINIGNTASFSPTWSGFSSAPGGTLNYVNLGAFAAIWSSTASVTGTSNSVNMQFNDIPAAIRPSSDRSAYVSVIDDGDSKIAEVVVTSAGAAIFNLLDDQGTDHITSVGTDFVASGTKGLGAGFFFMYPK